MSDDDYCNEVERKALDYLSAYAFDDFNLKVDELKSVFMDLATTILENLEEILND